MLGPLLRWVRHDSIRGVLRDASVLLSTKVVAGLLSVGYLSLSARCLGTEAFGTLVLIQTYVLGVGSLLVVQGRRTMVRFGALNQAGEGASALRPLLGRVLRVEVGTGIGAMAVAALGSGMAGALFGWDSDLEPYVVLYAFAIVSKLHDSCAGLLHVLGRFDLAARQQLAGPITRLVTVAVAAGCDAGLRGFLLAWLAGSVAEAAAQWGVAFFALRRAAPLSPSPGRSTPPPALSGFLLHTKLEVMLEELPPRLVPLLLGAWLGAASAGLYELAIRFGRVLAQPAAALGHALLPALAHRAAARDLAALRETVRRTSLTAAAAGGGVAALIALAGRPGLRLLGGEGFEAAYEVAVLVGVARALHLAAMPLASGLVGLGRPGVVVKVGALVNVLLLPVLVGLVAALGLVGAGVHAALVGGATWVALRHGLLSLIAESEEEQGSGGRAPSKAHAARSRT